MRALLTFVILLATLATVSAAQISSCTTISSAGYYTLASDIVNTTASTCLWIRASNVTIDGNGNKLAGSPSGVGILIGSNQVKAANITIRNITIANWSTGISVKQADNVSIFSAKIENSSDGISVGDPQKSSSRIAVDNCTIKSSANNGINIGYNVDNITIKNSIIVQNYIGISYGNTVNYHPNLTVYNNVFNNSQNVYSQANFEAIWNTTKQAGKNIIGGSYIGGNAWFSTTGYGYSQSCVDNDGDGICDYPYDVYAGKDYLPLAAGGLPPVQEYPISGRIYYSGSSTGVIYIEVLYSCDAFAAPLFSTNISAPGSYTVNVTSGSYYVRAFMDTNGNLSYDAGEPYGVAINKTSCQNADIIDATFSGVSGVDITLYEADTTPPVITIHSPQNKTYNAGSVALNVSANEQISSWWYNLDGGANISFTPNTTLTGLTDGVHTLTVYANDSAGNVGYAGVVFTVDTAKPSITFVPPTPANGSTISRNYLFVNITANEQLNTALLEWNGVNYTMQGSGRSWHINITGLSSGIYSFLAYGIDLAGNINSTEKRTVNVSIPVSRDNYILTLRIISGRAGHGEENNYMAELHIISRNAIVVEEGNYRLRLSSERALRANRSDLVAPSIAFVSPTPANGSTVNVDYVYINITASEALSQAILEWNGVNHSMHGSGKNWYINMTGLSSGIYSLRAYGRDFAGNWNATELRTVNVSLPEVRDTYILRIKIIAGSATGKEENSHLAEVAVFARKAVILEESNYRLYLSTSRIEVNRTDSIPPRITFVAPTPANNSVISVDYVYINITASEALSQAILEFNGVNYTMQGSGRNWYINKTSLANGVYTYRVYASDKAGNWNISETRVVNISLPQLIENYILRIYIAVNPSKIQKDAYDIELSIIPRRSAVITENNYILRLSSNKMVYSLAKHDTTPPAITFVNPTPASNSVINKDYVFINITANEPLSNALLSWNGINYTMQGSGRSWHYNVTGLADGTYTFKVYGKDLAGNWNVSETRIATVSVPGNQIPVSSCTTIDSAGYYVLTQDISGSSTCIRIQASNVILNGRAHSISGPGTGGLNYGIYVYSSTATLENVSIENIKVANWASGVYYDNANNGSIKNINASFNGIGIRLRASSNNKIVNSTISFNSNHGIYLYSSSNNNTIANNNISFSNYYGINIQYSSNNSISSNTISNTINGDGIYLLSSSNNTIANNNISFNSNYGIYFRSSSNNLIYNNYLNNSNNAYDNLNNLWNTTKKSGANIVGGAYIGGNYWGNPAGTGYSDTCIDSDADGICDSPYTAGNVIDYLPLTFDRKPPSVTINSPQRGNYTSPPLINLSAKDYSGILQVLAEIDGMKNITLSLTLGYYTANISNLWPGRHMIRVYAWDTLGNLNSTESVVFSLVGGSQAQATKNVTSGTKTEVNETLGNTSVELEIAPLVNDTIGVSVNESTNVSQLANTTNEEFSAFAVANNAQAIGRFVRIEVKGSSINNTANLSYVIVKLHYSTADLDKNGDGDYNDAGDIDPRTLHLYRYCPDTGTWDEIPHGHGWVCGNVEVFDSDVNTSAKYVWANLSHLSVFGIAGSVIPASLAQVPPAVGGVYSPEAVLLANSIDLALADEFVVHLRERGIKLYIVSAANFSEYSSKQYVIILGGHRAYEGVGDIVADILSDEEKARIEAGSAYIKKRSVFRSGDVVYIFAGMERNATREAWLEAYEEVAKEIAYNWG